MAFVPAHTFVSADDTTPQRWLLSLHGIYGRGGNWRTFARRLTEARPEWGVVLVDLRKHGRSIDAPPPHTVARAAEDLERLAAELAADDRPVAAVSGHSFGGKVALALRDRGPEWLQQTWMIDSSPSAHPGALDDPDNSVVRVLTMLESLPPYFADRKDFVDHVTGQGFAPMLGRWLAMNLEQPEGESRYRLGFDPAAMRELLTDYYAVDLWSCLEDADKPGEARLVVAGQADTVSPSDRDRIQALEAEMSGQVRYHLIEQSGHWVHIDALDELVTLVAAELV
jgi:pimeloyl-ACP methyl ester carboxylesterase